VQTKIHEVEAEIRCRFGPVFADNERFSRNRASAISLPSGIRQAYARDCAAEPSAISNA
jgi:hypothetical protein